MNEAAGQGPASGFDPAAGGDGASAGTLLRQAREAAGMHVSSLAVALKVPVRKLEALEADQFDQLPDAVFVRALAASVCRNLRIDPAPILQRLPATGAPRLAPTEGGINAPFRSPRDGAGPGWREQLSKPVFLAVFALLLGALVLILLPSRHDEVVSAPEVTPAPVEVAIQPPAPEPMVASAASAPAATVTVVAPVVPERVPVAAAPVTSNISPKAMPTAVPASLAPPVPVASQPALAAAVSVEGIVVFKAKAPSWIQVTDAKGAVPLRRLLAAGETAAASGALPLAVTVGSANATDVVVRGKPFDLTPLARDNVARFEVK